MKITIWDENGPRLQANTANLKKAAKELQIQVDILCQSEPPLLARMGLTGTTPVVEIDKHYWRLTIGEEISIEQFFTLLQKINSHAR